MRVRFIGDGGHAGNLKDICRLNGDEITNDAEYIILAYGGITCEALEKRFNQRDELLDNKVIPPNSAFPNIIHPSVIYYACFPCGGVQIMAGVIIQHAVTIGSFSIINTGAIIEHDSVIGRGCHIAPGAVVLGNVHVGDFCFIGANAVVVQGSTVPPRTFVKAGSVWKS